MGRAIVREPKAFLMDEPLSNLDAKLRVEMRAEISRIQRDLGVTTIYVTHDQTEAMTMGDRVAVLRGGVLQQVDSPQNLYTRPANLFVAEFIGSPAMNLVQGTLVPVNGGLGVRFGDHMLQVAERSVRERPALASYLEREIVIGIRPEDIEDAAHVREPNADQTLSVVTDLREDMGAEVVLHFSVHAEPVRATEVTEALEHEEFEAIKERALRQGVPFIARVDRLTGAREGEARASSWTSSTSTSSTRKAVSGSTTAWWYPRPHARLGRTRRDHHPAHRGAARLRAEEAAGDGALDRQGHARVQELDQRLGRRR